MEDNREFAKQLRKEMTKEERHLWYDYLRSYPTRIRRQEPIGKYVADFYCKAARLVIELDGSEHCSDEGEAHDKERALFLNGLGLFVLRFSNLDVMRHFEAVCAEIDKVIKERV